MNATRPTEPHAGALLRWSIAAGRQTNPVTSSAMSSVFAGFRRCAGSWRRRRLEDGVKGAGEVRSTVADQEPDVPELLVEVHGEVAACLQHRPGRTRASTGASRTEHTRSPATNAASLHPRRIYRKPVLS